MPSEKGDQNGVRIKKKNASRNVMISERLDTGCGLDLEMLECSQIILSCEENESTKP